MWSSPAPQTRRARKPSVRLLVLVATLFAGCSAENGEERLGGETAAQDARTRPQRLASLLSVLAADSMQGRRTGTSGAHRAASFLADKLEEYGIEAAGDSAYHQWVPMARVTVGSGDGVRDRLVLPSSEVRFDTLPEDRILRREANVVGILRGSDPEVADEAVIVGAHFDHVGIGPVVTDPQEGPDSIYNGADDDASGSVAVLEIARTLARGTPPGRSVVFLLSTGEEMGLLGTRWYIQNPVVPLDRTVADLQIEMIGRPDSLAGGPGRGWLTGYERTTMGRQLAEAGSPIVPDPRPDQNFFFRSDNIAFARIGIPAHTLSSFGLHDDYHQPSDEVDEIDVQHMAALVEAATEAVRFLADGPRPDWVPGGREGLPERSPDG
ncbi:MAG: M20/M25/M40 family metallo-hydrolase [Longimicrobiales bacterium]|nr:M20/M25/M40 family metallo-hydrolase [Longimicrobiales bacterium]